MARKTLKEYRTAQAQVARAWKQVEKTDSFTDIRRYEEMAAEMYEAYADDLADTVDTLIAHIDALGGTK